MKILVVCQYYYPEPFRIHEVCEGLVQKGHEVTVLTGLPNYPMGVIPEEYRDGKRRLEEIGGVKIIRVKETPRTKGKIGLAKNYVSFVLNGSLKALTMKKDFDVIFVYQLSPILMAIPAYVAKWFAKTKKLKLYCLDLWPESLVSLNISRDSAFFKIIKGVSKRIYNGADCIAYTSRKFEDYFTKELKLKQKNYMYIPQFADELFSSVSCGDEAEDKSDALNKSAQDKDKQTLNYVFAGNVGQMQSVDTIIKAASLCEDDRIRWHIVGDGFALEECRALSQELNLEDKVTFYGRLPVEEMPRFYKMADAMLVTLSDDKAISYTLPGKVQSYMAAKRPILAAADGEIPDLIKAAGCGMCAKSGDYKELAGLAVKMADSDREKMGECSRRYYEEHFSKGQHIDNIEKLLKE